MLDDEVRLLRSHWKECSIPARSSKSRPEGVLLHQKRINSSEIDGVLSIDGIQLVSPQVSHQYPNCGVKWTLPVMLRLFFDEEFRMIIRAYGELSSLASRVS